MERQSVHKSEYYPQNTANKDWGGGGIIFVHFP